MKDKGISQPKEHLRTPAAADYCGRSPRTMEGLRTRGGGPPYYKRGGIVVYRRDELDDWLAEGRRVSTGDADPSSRTGERVAP